MSHVQTESTPDRLLSQHQQAVDQSNGRGPGDNQKICDAGGALEVSQSEPECAHDDEQDAGSTWRQDRLKDAGQSTPEQQFLHEWN